LAGCFSEQIPWSKRSLFCKQWWALLRGRALSIIPVYLHAEQILTLMVGCVASVPVLVAVQKRLDKAEGSSAIVLDSAFRLLGLGGLSTIFLVSAMKMASSTYNPFIYFRF
jgi:alginate O-acetyltransferase complex protein AlgI